MKKILLGLLTLMATIVSCTDQEDIEIGYSTTLNVSASHIFDTYRSISTSDFDLSQYDGWQLNIISLVYNSDGTLMKKFEGNSSMLNYILSQNIELNPGEYKLVSIARFGKVEWSGFSTYWDITGEEDLSTLTITEVNEMYQQFVFETLGIKTQSLTITNVAQNINIEIPPVTGLLEIFLWGEDMIGNGINGYSQMAPYCKEINIWATQLTQQVKFNGTEILYDYGVQNEDYCIAQFSPKSQYLNGLAPNQYNYRALLPISNRDFYWDISFDSGKGSLFGLKDKQESDYSDKINIESGKQYTLDLLFDGLYLFASDYVEDESQVERRERLVDQLNANNFSKIMDRNFDTFIGLSQSSIENTFGDGGYLSGDKLYYFYYNEYVYCLTFGFDSSTNTVNTISLIFKNINDDFRERMITYLANRFSVYDKGTDEHTKAFINGEALSDSSIGVTWNLDQDVLTYVKLK